LKKDSGVKELTDERGIAIFESIPMDIYVLEVKANKNFMKESQVISVLITKLLRLSICLKCKKVAKIH